MERLTHEDLEIMLYAVKRLAWDSEDRTRISNRSGVNTKYLKRYSDYLKLVLKVQEKVEDMIGY